MSNVPTPHTNYTDIQLRTIRFYNFTYALFGQSWVLDVDRHSAGTVDYFLRVNDSNVAKSWSVVMTSGEAYATEGNYFKKLDNDRAIAHIYNLWKLYESND